MEFINTFNNGMHKDSSPSFQPKGTYRHLVDCQIISQDGNNYSIKDCLGNVLTFTLEIPYDGTTSDLQAPPTVLAFVSFPDSLYCFYSNGINSEGFGGIAKINYSPYGGGIDSDGVTILYCHEDLDFSLLHRIEAVAIQENDERKRIYWTDNNNEPRVINVADPIYTTYYGTTGLTLGTRYMVLQGAITHNATVYGPGLTAGNVFTAAGTTYSVTDASPLVIEYYPHELFGWSPNRTLGTMTFAGYGTGTVYYGNKVYLYRYGLTSEGTWTPWSYPSSPVHITAPNDSDYDAGSDYHNTVGNGTSSDLEQSDKSVQITINEVDINYDRIQMACVEFDQSSTVPRQITIVADENITGATEMTLEHTGIHLGELTVDDLTDVPAIIDTVKSLATNKNYLFAAHTTEREELSLAADYTDGVTIASFDYEMPSYYSATACGALMRYGPEVPTAGANPGAGDVMPGSRYVVTFGELSPSSNTVTYDSVEYVTGEVITGVDDVHTITCAGTGAVRPCVTRNKYSTISGSNRRENYVEIPSGDAFWDYKSATVAHHCRGYWSGETYRFGVLFYDKKKGNPYYVRHIGDYTFPTITAKGGLLVQRSVNLTADCYNLNVSGAKITGLKIPTSLADEISGFSIVRAPRDKRIITQGLVTQCRFTSGTPNIYYPVGWATPNGQGGGAAALAGPDSSSTSYYCFVGPDQLVSYDTGFTLGGNSTDTLEMAGWLEGLEYDTDVWAKGISGDARTSQSTFIDPLTGDTDKQASEVTFWKELVEGEQIDSPDWDSGDNSFSNRLVTNTSASTYPEVVDTCSGGGGTTTYDTVSAEGGKKVVFTRATDIHDYATSTLYNDSSQGASAKKILMNYCVTNTNPYGGDGAEALANTVYMSTGHYQELSDTVKSETLSGDNYVFNDIEIFGGDCFVSLVDYSWALWSDTLDGVTGGFAQAWFFPCESNVNYALRRGRKVSNVQMYPSGGGAGGEDLVYDVGGVARLEEYSYNPGYSAVGDNVLYPALPTNYSSTTTHPTRIRYSGPRQFGALVDNLRNFLPNNYTDLDGAGGSINKIATKDGRVIVWQDLMTGTVPVLERLLVSATTLGTGGVLDRFDILKSDFGTQHQWSVIEADYGFLWFDMRRKAVMILDSGIGEISQITGNKSFFDEIFVEGDGDTSSATLLNSPSFADSSDRPLTGIGITGVYDPKFKITYLTCKFKHLSGSVSTNQNFTIGYYHPERKFVGFFTFQPGIAHNHNGIVFACNIPRSYPSAYEAGMASTIFNVGETVAYNNAEWVCIQQVEIASYPGSASQVPDFGGSAFWAKVNQINQIWVNNQPATLAQSTAPDYQYNKWFGLATTSELWFVVNPGAGPINVQYIEEIGNNSYPTTVTVQSSTQTASDTSIQSWDKNFRYIWDRLTHSMPLSSTGRVVGDYALIKLIKKNWSTDRRTVTGTTKIINYIKSFFVQKR